MLALATRPQLLRSRKLALTISESSATDCEGKGSAFRHSRRQISRRRLVPLNARDIEFTYVSTPNRLHWVLLRTVTRSSFFAFPLLLNLSRLTLSRETLVGRALGGDDELGGRDDLARRLELAGFDASTFKHLDGRDYLMIHFFSLSKLERTTCRRTGCRSDSPHTNR